MKKKWNKQKNYKKMIRLLLRLIHLDDNALEKSMKKKRSTA